MPIYEHRCADCGAVLEILSQVGAPGPRRCGHRCALDRWDPRADLRGDGRLERILSPTATVRGHLTRDTPSEADLASAGFTTWENLGGGAIRRVDPGGDGQIVEAGDPER